MRDEISDLFAQTLVGDYDDEGPWNAIRSLRDIGSRAVFDQAAQWLAAPDPLRRARAADVLAQLGVDIGRPHAFPEEACDLLIARADIETDPRARASAIFGLGHIARPQALSVLLRAAAADSPFVRHAAAFALGSFPQAPEARACLLRLIRDPEDDVRDWATFALGVLSDADSEEIRDALAQLLDDSFFDVRVEAMKGLAKRHDPRVVAPLIGELENRPEEPNGLIEAGLEYLGLDDMPPGWTTTRDLTDALRQVEDHVAPCLRVQSRRDHP